MKVRNLIAGALAVGVAGAGIGFLSDANASTTKAAAVTTYRSGLTWQSGAYLDHKPGNIAPFVDEARGGKPMDLVEVFTAYDSPSAMTDTWWLSSVKPVTDAGGKAVISVPLWTKGQSASTDTTAQMTTLSNNIKSAGLAGKVIIRLGWEMNINFAPLGDSYNWSVTSANRTAWVNSFKRSAAIFRDPTKANATVTFNPNEGASQNGRLADLGTLANDLAPSYDWIGIDDYNWYPPSNTDAQWNTRYNATYGMKYWEDKAIALGKGFAVPEWGGMAAAQDGNGTSDHTLYTAKMIGRFAALSKAGVPVWDSYFAEPGSWWKSTISRHYTDSSTSTLLPADLPALRDAYRSALSSSAPVPTPSTSTSSATPSPSTSTPNC